jgi:CHAD domain-containing protein/CYTH domain-containing protein
VTLPEYLLDLPAEEAARLIVLALLDRAVQAGGRLADPTDPMGLHDFRVAVRRLRSVMRAFRAEIKPGFSRGVLRRLSRLAQLTGESRDLEVQLGWARAQEAGLVARHLAGLRWHVERLERERRLADRRLGRLVARRFGRLERRMRAGLESYRLRIERDLGHRRHAAGAVLGARLRKFGGDLECRLAAVRGLRDRAAAHRARTAAKRLRYLLEPIRTEVDGVEPLIGQLRALQDVLGGLHDSQIHRERLIAALRPAGRAYDLSLAEGVASAEPVSEEDPRPGLLALIERLDEREAEAFARLRHDWLGDAGHGFFEAVTALGVSLTHRPACVEEIQRRFLLRRVPASARPFAIQEIEQGWLPGTRLVERIRALRPDVRLVTYRSTKWSTGARDDARHGEVDQSLFEEIWPLTAGRRLIKRRHVVSDYGLEWEIDQFLDRDLVIADVVVSARDAAVIVPEWLEPYIVREVTGDGAYTSPALAR